MGQIDLPEIFERKSLKSYEIIAFSQHPAGLNLSVLVHLVTCRPRHWSSGGLSIVRDVN